MACSVLAFAQTPQFEVASVKLASPAGGRMHCVGGPKLKESKEPVAAPPEMLWTPPAGGPPVRTVAHIIRRSSSVADLANFLSNQLGQPVIDATGLTGRYDYDLSFLMEPGGRATAPVASSGSDPEIGTTLIDSVRSQLGLRLEKEKGQTDILVVDHAEKIPAEN